MAFFQRGYVYCTIACSSLLFILSCIFITHLKGSYRVPPDDEKWVAVVLQYQLGNQLWVLASSYGIARARNAHWCAVQGSWHSYTQDLEWPSVMPPVECPGVSWGIPVVMDTWYMSAFTKIQNGYMWATYTGDVFLNASAQHAYMDGLLQSFKYFDPITPVPFRLKQTMRARAWVAARNATVAIHIRRGDQLDRVGIRIPPLDYYRRALRLLRTLFPAQAFVVVVATDDPGWVRAQLLFRGMYVLSSHDPAFDMAVISQCRHKIISIGTFGWWGAYLSDPGHNRSNAVIYPMPQLERGAGGGFTEADYFPAHWTRLDYSKP